MKHFCFLILYISLSISLGVNDAFADEALWGQYISAGRTAYQQGDYQEAAKQFEDALKEAEKFGEEDPRYGTSLNNLAVVYYKQGRYADAAPFIQRVLSILEKTLGPEHTDVAITLNNLAELYRAQGRYAEAEPLYQRALSIREKVLGPEHLNVAESEVEAAMHYAQRILEDLYDDRESVERILVDKGRLTSSSPEAEGE